MTLNRFCPTALRDATESEALSAGCGVLEGHVYGLETSARDIRPVVRK